MIELHVPLPPSLNQLYPGKVRRHKSDKYKAWIRDATLMLNQQHIEKFNVPVSISYAFGKPDNRRRDLDNLFKACNDLLVSYGIIEDDSLIHHISGMWLPIEGADVRIVPFRMEDYLGQT